MLIRSVMRGYYLIKTMTTEDTVLLLSENTPLQALYTIIATLSEHRSDSRLRLELVNWMGGNIVICCMCDIRSMMVPLVITIASSITVDVSPRITFKN